jgi:hypothetical protein
LEAPLLWLLMVLNALVVLLNAGIAASVPGDPCTMLEMLGMLVDCWDAGGLVTAGRRGDGLVWAPL